MDTVTVVQPPALDIDAYMLKQYGQKPSLVGKAERRIVANLFSHLERHGFSVTQVYDGDDFTACTDAKSAMELIFDLDEVSVRFEKRGTNQEHGVLLVLGNGEDIVNDWNYTIGDPDGFNAAMKAFDAGLYA